MIDEFKRTRNKEIVRMIDEQHMTATAVGKWFNISKQRVSQIYNREKSNVQDIRSTGNGENHDSA